MFCLCLLFFTALSVAAQNQLQFDIYTNKLYVFSRKLMTFEDIKILSHFEHFSIWWNLEHIKPKLKKCIKILILPKTIVNFT